MTELTVNPGPCGFTCRISAQKKKRYLVSINLESQCAQIGKLAREVPELDFMQILSSNFSESPFAKTAGKCSVHQSCPVPCGIIKAVEAELKMAVKKDVTLAFGNGTPE